MEDRASSSHRNSAKKSCAFSGLRGKQRKRNSFVKASYHRVGWIWIPRSQCPWLTNPISKAQNFSGCKTASWSLDHWNPRKEQTEGKNHISLPPIPGQNLTLGLLRVLTVGLVLPSSVDNWSPHATLLFTSCNGSRHLLCLALGADKKKLAAEIQPLCWHICSKTPSVALAFSTLCSPFLGKNLLVWLHQWLDAPDMHIWGLCDSFPIRLCLVTMQDVSSQWMESRGSQTSLAAGRTGQESKGRFGALGADNWPPLRTSITPTMVVFIFPLRVGTLAFRCPHSSLPRFFKEIIWLNFPRAPKIQIWMLLVIWGTISD